MTAMPPTYRASALAAAVFFAASICAPDARAQEPTPDATDAHAQYRRAMNAIDQKDWNEARRLLLALWEGAQTYDVAASLSQVEFQLGNRAASARYLSFAIANAPPMESPKRIERFRAGLDDLRSQLGTVLLRVSDPTARVTVDGTAIPTLAKPFETFLAPGTHTLEASIKSGSATARVIDVAAGGKYEVDLIVSAPASAPPSASAAPSGTSETAPIVPAPLPPHDATGLRRSLVPVYIGIGLAAGGAAMAVGFGIAAKGARDELRSMRDSTPSAVCSGGSSDPTCQDIRDTYDRQRRNADLARVGVGVFAVSSVATAAYLLFWPRKPGQATAAAVVPVVSPNAVGLSGSF
ncbi:MAG: tetratricopeptide repeat protein [Myxococcota bacterium]